MPYPYTYFNPNKKEQVALGAGSLISALLGAASGQNGSDAAVRGLAGLTGGYGAGYQNYQDLMNNAFQRDINERRYNQNIREYEEVDKPLKQAHAQYYGEGYHEPGMGPLNLHKAIQSMTPEERNSFWDTQSKLGYNRFLGFDETGQGTVIPTKGNVTLRTVGAGTGESSSQGGGKPVGDIQPPVKQALPAEKTTELTDFDTLINFAEAAKQLHKNSYTGPVEGRYGTAKAKYVGVDNNQQLFYDYLTNIRDKTYKLISGGQIPVDEAKRMMENVAHAKWADKTVINKLDNFIKINKELNDQRKKGLAPNYRNIPGGQAGNQSIAQPVQDPMQELIGLAKSGDQEAIQYLQSKGLNK